MIIILLLITLVFLGMCGEHQTSYVWSTQSNHTENIAITAIDNSTSNSGNILSELMMGICLLASGSIFLLAAIGLLIAISLFIEANGFKLITTAKYILQKFLMAWQLDFSQGWEKPENQITSKDNNSNFLVKVICSKIDEEGRAYLSDAKLEWVKLGLTYSQINREGLKFVISHYRGRFIQWLRLPRFLYSIKTKY